ncbi:MAG: DUF4365 domain-containing protein [Polaromonas sp.]|uniref:DUF4365 domain-containing protein n=1 Tax=Polaromonas sp. TaxID=1869339 RepID=UPI003267B45D
MTSPISSVDIEAELSYAFLHAVASHAQATCRQAERLSDNRGIDVQLTSWGPFPPGAKKEVDLKIQLKATISTPADLGTHLSYSIKKTSQYDDLRAVGAYAVPRILVVLFLPVEEHNWLDVTEHSLALKKSAYWVSLSGAAAVTTASATVHIPKTNLLTSSALRTIFAELSQGRLPSYTPMGGST